MGIESGKTIILERERVEAAAVQHKVSLYGI
jgi:hypothetical protein